MYAESGRVGTMPGEGMVWPHVASVTDTPLNRSMSTGPETPGTCPVSLYCQNVHVVQPPGIPGSGAVVPVRSW